MAIDNIWVFAQAANGAPTAGTLELLTKARELGDEVGARRFLSDAVATNPNFSILHAADAARVLASLETGR